MDTNNNQNIDSDFPGQLRSMEDVANRTFSLGAIIAKVELRYQLSNSNGSDRVSIYLQENTLKK
jgi:hypothetical protein